MKHQKNRSFCSVCRRIFTAFFLGLALLCAGCGRNVVYEEVMSPQVCGTEDVISEESTEKAAETVFVFVCGAVVREGVYELPEHARVVDAIQAAGGLRSDADGRAVNQAELLTDGSQIVIPTFEETEAGWTGGAAQAERTQAETDGKININTADAETLQKLNGIGASRAADIIAYREMHGKFASIEEIMNVSGIKNALFEKIRDSITVQ